MKFRFPFRKKTVDCTPEQPARNGTAHSSHRMPKSASGETSPQSQHGQHTLRAHHESLTKRACDQQDALADAIEVLKKALAEMPLTGDPDWTERVAAELESVRELMRAHAAGVEEPEGLFDEIKTVQPRLAARAEALQQEHESLAARAAGLAKDLSENTHSVDRVRKETRKLLSRLRVHRASETELVYEAFWTELGTGD